MQYSTTTERVAKLWRDGKNIVEIADKVRSSRLIVTACLGMLRSEAGAKTNEELRTILKGWGK